MSAQDDAYRHVVRKGLALKSTGSLSIRRKRKKSPHGGRDNPEPSQFMSDDNEKALSENSAHGNESEDAPQPKSDSPEEKNEQEDAVVEKVLKLEGMTSAEKTFHLARLKRQRERVERRTALTHRERMARLNEHLSKLSEHFDIPKVGPG
eukprot:Gregarina_sp_Poly_1__869@NODE_1207_length_4783_cov_48_825700_g827_i0_p5_GENE_NODE_1207_length_4783_cov_48_825700_g827_i0NODE_1207_length_4783_cov_48_825700_g827_i0_p5_ORF_typecomplete_len150_score31_19DUF1754/PF08555_10/7_8e06RhoGAPFF1/PF16512_5/0_14Holin_BhlA/PF10960_8/7_2e03Holin_BhlA/PF10960_8/0_069SpoIIIAH/PF12685_7/0_23TMEM247/PF15444_6/0_48_NODE_1207_length_4783_cov_48_825700_g827_i09051354